MKESEASQVLQMLTAAAFAKIYSLRNQEPLTSAQVDVMKEIESDRLLAKEFNEILRTARRIIRKNSCVICHQSIDILGVFYPGDKDKNKIETPVNKLRVVVYGLCSNCDLRPNKLEEAEEMIFRSFSAERN